MKKSPYKIKSRIWITHEDETFLGEGRIALLKEIEIHGSIAKAAKAMKMSYKKAWGLVCSMNSHGDCPLVIQKVGGSGGGGSVLTEKGKKAISLFNELNKSSNDFLVEKIDSTFNLDD